MARLTIVLLTYNRFDYAMATITSTLDNIKFTGDLAVHIADDGSGMAYIEGLKQAIEKFNGRLVTVSASNSARRGYGANYNLAMQTVHQSSEFVLPLEDDWLLQRPLYADEVINALNEKRFGCVRMGYLGYTQELKGTLLYCAGNHYLLIDPNTPEPHVFAGHPRIETTEWAKTVGPWPEGLDPNLTEFTVAHKPAARKGVAWPLDLIPPRGNMFAHIGSVRAR